MGLKLGIFQDGNWSFTIFDFRSATPAIRRGRGASIFTSGAPLAPFNRGPRHLFFLNCLAQSGVGSRELLLALVTQVCAPAPRTSRRLQPFPSARRLVAGQAPLTPANFRSSLAGLPPPLRLNTPPWRRKQKRCPFLRLTEYNTRLHNQTKERTAR